MDAAAEATAKQLEEAGIVAPESLREVLGSATPPGDAAALVAQLVERGLLTKFQGQQVSAGKTKTLVIGSYVMLDRITGGGPFFKARHRRMKRVVAVKPLPPTLMKDPVSAAAVRRDVEAAGQFDHPNLVGVEDIDEVSGAHFIVAEFVDGPNLTTLAGSQPKPTVEQACGWIAQAAAGLAYAHSRGVALRDVRPEHLLVDRSGTVKVFGFGLAPSAGGDVNADARIDVAGLARVLYRLLGGAEIPAGSTTIPPLHDARPEVPAGLDAYLARMLSANAVERPTMPDVAVALRSLDTLPKPAADAEPVAPFAFDDAEPELVPEPVPVLELAAVSAPDPEPEAEVILDLEPAPLVEPAPIVTTSAAIGPSIAVTSTTATTPTTARKPTKRGKQQPLPFGIPEKYAKYLTPKYLIGGAAGVIVVLSLMLWMVVGGRGRGGAKPEQVEKIRVIPPRTQPVPTAPATARGPVPTPTAGLFNLPVTEAFPTGKRAK